MARLLIVNIMMFEEKYFPQLGDKRSVLFVFRKSST